METGIWTKGDVCRQEAFSTFWVDTNHLYCLSLINVRLIYRVPGTGKSLIVKAYHEEAIGSNLLEISMGDLLSRYVGDGECALNAAFQAAERHSPCILFLGL